MSDIQATDISILFFTENSMNTNYTVKFPIYGEIAGVSTFKV